MNEALPEALEILSLCLEKVYTAAQPLFTELEKMFLDRSHRHRNVHIYERREEPTSDNRA